MANTVHTTTISNSNNVAIPFDFIDSSHISVYLDDVLKTSGTDYRINSSNEVDWIVTPSTPATLKIRRNTPSTPIVDWTQATRIDQDSLATTTKQALYLQQELEERPGSEVELETLYAPYAPVSYQYTTDVASHKAGLWEVTASDFKDYTSLEIIYSFVVDGGTETAAAGGYQYGCQVVLHMDTQIGGDPNNEIVPMYGNYGLTTNDFVIAGDNPQQSTTSPWFAGKGSSPATSAGTVWGKINITGWNDKVIRVTADSHWINAGAGTAVGGVGRYEPTYFFAGLNGEGEPSFDTALTKLRLQLYTTQVSDGTQGSLTAPGYVTGSVGQMTLKGIY